MVLCILFFAIWHPLFIKKTENYTVLPEGKFDDNIKLLETLEEINRDYQMKKITEKEYKELVVITKQEFQGHYEKSTENTKHE